MSYHLNSDMFCVLAFLASDTGDTWEQGAN